jgi:hypothetical protein
VIAKDTAFECTAAFGAATAKVDIVQADDKGGVSIRSVTGILIAAKLEAQIANQLGKQLNVHVTVSCGERVRASVAGDRFLCEAKDAKGASGKVAVSVEDTSGKASFALVPSDGSAPPAENPAAPTAPTTP